MDHGYLIQRLRDLEEILADLAHIVGLLEQLLLVEIPPVLRVAALDLLAHGHVGAVPGICRDTEWSDEWEDNR